MVVDAGDIRARASVTANPKSGTLMAPRVILMLAGFVAVDDALLVGSLHAVRNRTGNAHGFSTESARANPLHESDLQRARPGAPASVLYAMTRRRSDDERRQCRLRSAGHPVDIASQEAGQDPIATSRPRFPSRR
jgi:hypothetical protein